MSKPMIVLLTDKDRNNFAQTLSGLREIGWAMHGNIFVTTEYENGLPVRDLFSQLFIKSEGRINEQAPADDKDAT